MAKAQRNVVVLAGPNGAGKSTVAPVLLSQELKLKEFVNADVIAQGLSGFSPESVALEAGRIMLRRLYTLAQEGHNFAFETTLATRSFAPWLDKLRAESDYVIRLVFIWLPGDEIAIQRVADRVAMGGHNVPQATIQRRYLRGLLNLFDLYMPICEDWRIYNATGRTPDLIAAGSFANVTDVYRADDWRDVMKGAGR